MTIDLRQSPRPRCAALRLHAGRAPRVLAASAVLGLLLASGCSSEPDAASHAAELDACCAPSAAAPTTAHVGGSHAQHVDLDEILAAEEDVVDEAARLADFLSGADSRPLPADDGTGLPIHVVLPDFALTADDGRAFTRADLLGRVWVVNFIFTRCPGPCPAMSSAFTKLAREEIPAQLLSISVDPEFDTPAVLAGYRDMHGVAAETWRLLTGSSQDIQALAEQGFRLPVNAGRTPLAGMPPTFHSGRFALVDARGRVRGYYNHDDRLQQRALRKDAEALSTLPAQ